LPIRERSLPVELQIAAWGTLAVGVIGAMAAAFVNWRKQRSDDQTRNDKRADVALNNTIKRLDTERLELKKEVGTLRIDLSHCEEQHARTDERLKHVEQASRRCEEDRLKMARRLDELEDTVRQQ
jgi:septal ring factor EnvC (AmiA/AmiB activator)